MTCLVGVVVVIGIQTAFFGVSATFFTLIYNGPFHSTDLAGYQLFVTILQPCVALACATLLIPIGGHKSSSHGHSQNSGAPSGESTFQFAVFEN